MKTEYIEMNYINGSFTEKHQFTIMITLKWSSQDNEKVTKICLVLFLEVL